MVNYKERFNKTEKNRWSGLTISLCIVVVFYMLLSHIGSIKGFFNSFLAITSTVIIGAVIAYTVNPLAVFIYKRLKKAIKKNENAAWIISAVVSLIFVLAFVVALLVVITPMLVENITNFAMGLSGYMNSLKALVLSSELDEDRDLHGLLVSNAQSADELGFLTALFNPFADRFAAAVYNNRLKSYEFEERHVLDHVSLQFLIVHGASAVLDHDDLAVELLNIGKRLDQYGGLPLCFALFPVQMCFHVNLISACSICCLRNMDQLL